jgi:pyruvate/2-oxoglutarate dehydrogenase complex dihydrolipoamide dehydrogenase (E3) component
MSRALTICPVTRSVWVLIIGGDFLGMEMASARHGLGLTRRQQAAQPRACPGGDPTLRRERHRSLSIQALS